MKVIAGNRRTGRTTKLIKMAAEAEANGEISYIVCHSHKEAGRIAELAAQMDLVINHPMTYSEFLAGRGRPSYINYYIDNAEFFIESIMNRSIRAITITTDDPA